ncbi:tetratricopeptide repeat protein [Fodinicurvata halophila]|uniref:Tetratricopeptide repeat protein n=1 Tax=Fodinicurvata halophila TaxID=1419723 RepID=A0ABV8UJA8_9PROT
MKNILGSCLSMMGRIVLIVLSIAILYSLFFTQSGKALPEDHESAYLKWTGTHLERIRLRHPATESADMALLRKLAGDAEPSFWKRTLQRYQGIRAARLATDRAPEHSVHSLQTVVLEAPDNPFVNYHHLQNLIARKQTQAALRKSLMLSASHPEFGAAARVAARLTADIGRPNEATVLYRQALAAWQSESAFLESLEELLHLLRQENQNRDIVTLYNKLVEYAPLTHDHYMIAAYSHLALGLELRANELFMKVSQLPETPDRLARQALFMSAVILERQRRIAEALLALEGAVALERFRSADPRERSQRATMIGHLSEKLGARRVTPAYFGLAHQILPAPENSRRFVRALATSRRSSQALQLLLERQARHDCWNTASDISKCLTRLASNEDSRRISQPGLESLLQSRDGQTQLLDIAHGLQQSDEPLRAAELFALLAGNAPTRSIQQARLLDQATALARASRHDKAAVIYLKAHRLVPNKESWHRAVSATQRTKDWRTLDMLFRDSTRPRNIPPVLQALACRTDAKLDNLDAAFSCYTNFVRQHPEEEALIREAVDLADQHQKPEMAISYLEALKGVRSAEELLDLGYRYKSLQRTAEAEEHFDRAYQDKGLAQAGLALALSLRKRGRIARAAAYFKELHHRPDLPRRSRLLVEKSLGHIHARSHDHAKAIEHWTAALELRDSASVRLRLANSLARDARHQESLSELETVDRTSLRDAEKALYHDLHAEHSLQAGNQDYALVHLNYALQQEATADRYLALASELKRAGHDGDALHFLEEAQARYPEREVFRVEQAYLLSRTGKDTDAAELLERALEQDPHFPGARANLGFTYLRLGETQKAGQALRQAMDEGNYARLPESKPADKPPKAVLQQQHRQLDRPFSLTFSNFLCFPEGAACQRMISPFGQSHDLGYGQFSAGWRPLGGTAFHGWSHLLELTARVYWSNKAGLTTGNLDTSQAALGMRTYPFPDRNYWLSGERVLPVGDQAVSGWLLRAGFSESLGDDWRLPGAGLRFYGHSYNEAARLFSDNDLTSAFSEGRAGLSWQAGRRLMLLPFGYVRGGGQIIKSSDKRRDVRENETSRTVILYPDTTGDVWVEGGLGLSARWRFNHDRYNGYLGQTETLLRIGRDIHTTWGKPATRVSLHFQVSF